MLTCTSVRAHVLLCLSLRRNNCTFFCPCTSFWLQIQRSRVRSPALPDFLSSSGSGTGSTQPREVNWGATWMKKLAADHVTPLYPQKLALTSPTGGGRSVCIVRVRTKVTEFSFLVLRWKSPHDMPMQAQKKQRYRYKPFATSALERVDDQLYATVVLPGERHFTH